MAGRTGVESAGGGREEEESPEEEEEEEERAARSAHTLSASAHSSATKCRGFRCPKRYSSGWESSYEHSRKMALSKPARILGAASFQTRNVLGASDTVSGSTSPNIRISRPVCSSRIKNAVLSVTLGSGAANCERDSVCDVLFLRP